MLVSVIVPFFNELHLIDRAIESVLSNVGANYYFEILICNDGSYSSNQIISCIPDGAESITRVLANIYPSGPGGARNTGIDFSSGEVLAFLDADDYWVNGKMEKQVALIEAGFSFVCCSYRFENASVVVTPPDIIVKPEEIFLKRGIGTSTVSISRSLLDDKRFKDIRFSQDIDFWYRLSKSPDFNYISVPDIGAVYSTSGSTKNKFFQLYYTYKVLLLNRVGVWTIVRTLVSYTVSGLSKHYIKRLIRSRSIR